MNSHEGANFDPVFCDFPDALVDSEELVRTDIFEWTEERDGEELRGGAESADSPEPPSG